MADSGQLMGGAMMKYQFISSSGTTTERLLVYRGGFLDFEAPDAPGTTGTCHFYDGKGRVYNKAGSPLYGNEFSGDGSDATDYGNQLYNWLVKSGKPWGQAYNIPHTPHQYHSGGGHTPLGWFTDEVKTPPSDPDQPYEGSSTRILQGAMVRWAQDNNTDAAQSGLQVYAGAQDWPFPESSEYDSYVYDPAVDGSLGAPGNSELHFEYLLDPIPPSTMQNRTGIAIHPDGECDGTAGCIGIQTWKDCNRVQYTLKNYHGLKIKVESQ